MPMGSASSKLSSGLWWWFVVLLLDVVLKRLEIMAGSDAQASSLNKLVFGGFLDMVDVVLQPLFSDHRGDGRQRQCGFLLCAGAGEQGFKAATMEVFGSSSSAATP
jgi:hypothetical protein